MDDALTIEVRHEQGYAMVTAAGEIDISTVTLLRERLFELAAGGRPLVADLDQVSFMDSAGLAALVGTAKRAAAHGGSLQVACARPKIRRLFRLTGLDCRIPLASTLDEALEAMAAAGASTAFPPARTPPSGIVGTRAGHGLPLAPNPAAPGAPSRSQPPRITTTASLSNGKLV